MTVIKKKNTGDVVLKYNTSMANSSPRQVVLLSGLTPTWKWLLLSVFVAFGFLAISGILNSNFSAVEYEKHKPVSVLNSNQLLSKGTRFLSNVITGPESIEFDSLGNMYAGLADGRIVKIYPSNAGALGEGRLEEVTVEKPASGELTECLQRISRPLGFRIVRDELFIADAYCGIYSVNLTDKSRKSIVDPNDADPSMKFVNDLTVTEDGQVIYFTDTSTKWHIDAFALEIAEGRCTGRLFGFRMSTRSLSLIKSGLCFANGVQLSNDQKILVVAETSRNRVNFIQIGTGLVTKQIDMPGMPDNIRMSKKGSYWIAIPGVQTMLGDTLSAYPTVKNILAGILPQKYSNNLLHINFGFAVEVDSEGNLVQVVQDTDTNTNVCFAVSQITEASSGELFVGSFAAPYFVKVKV